MLRCRADVLLCTIQFFPLIMISKIIKKLTYKIKSLNAPPSSTVRKLWKCALFLLITLPPFENLRDLTFLKRKGFAFNSGTWLKDDVK